MYSSLNFAFVHVGTVCYKTMLHNIVMNTYLG